MKTHLSVFYKLAVMDASQIRSRISELQDRLNIHRQDNKIRRHIEAIRSNINSDTDSVDPVSEKRRRTRTNHEVGSASDPIDLGQEESSRIHIPNRHIEKLDRELTSIIDDIEELSSDVDDLDPDGLSDSLRNLNQGLFGLYDDLRFTLAGSGGQTRFREHANIINNKTVDLEGDIDNLAESLDDIENELNYARTHLGKLTVPDKESVEDEVHKARSEQADREFEEMKPYISMQRLRREFEVGEVFDVEDLAEKVDIWSETTARSCIEDAKKIDDHAESPSIEEVAEDKYKLIN